MNINIESLKQEIQEQEILINNALNKANNYFGFTCFAFLLTFIFLFKSLFIVSIVSFLIGFFGIRTYNKEMGRAQFHNSIMKFLKFILIREQTGDDSIPGFLC